MTGDANLAETGFWINTLLLQSPPMYNPQSKEGDEGRGEGEGGGEEWGRMAGGAGRRGHERFIVCDVIAWSACLAKADLCIAYVPWI